MSMKKVFGVDYKTKKDLQNLIVWAKNEIKEYEYFIEECKKRISHKSFKN